MNEIRREKDDPTIEYLRRALVLDMQIDAYFERIQKLRARAERRTAAYGRDKVSASASVDSRMDVVARIVDAERDLDERIDRMIAARAEIQDTIEHVANEKMRALLQMRYLNGRTWEDIADQMNYSTRNVYNLHSAALKAVAPFVAIAEGRSAQLAI